jgi:hypothetical protein
MYSHVAFELLFLAPWVLWVAWVVFLIVVAALHAGTRADLPQSYPSAGGLLTHSPLTRRADRHRLS